MTTDRDAERAELVAWCERAATWETEAGHAVNAETLRRIAALIAQPSEDAERLDWLEQHGGLIGIDHIACGDFRYYAGDGFKPIRDAIDAALIARKQEKS